jgi:hypothetical protein
MHIAPAFAAQPGPLCPRKYVPASDGGNDELGQ